MTSLRILIGAETYPPDVNGAARFAERLANGLAGRGHEVHVVTPSPTGPPSREVRDGVTVHGVRSHRYFRHEHFQVCMPWEAGPATAALRRRDRARTSCTPRRTWWSGGAWSGPRTGPAGRWWPPTT